MSSLDKLTKQQKAQKETISFAGNSVTIYSTLNSQKINILPFLKNPASFHGDFNVDNIVCFANIYEKLIGKYHNQYGIWKIDQSPKHMIICLEYFYNEAKFLMKQINNLAKKVINNPKLYFEKKICQEYFNLTKASYKMLKLHEKEFFTKKTKILASLERAGLVTTRLAQGVSMDKEINNEIKVITKRTHLKEDPDYYLTVTVRWRDKNKIKALNRKVIELNDFVNPASGASTAALILVLKLNNLIPKEVFHRSITATKQGIMFTKSALAKLDIKTSFYTLGIAEVLDKHYYLTDKPVGDAGDFLNQFLPKNNRYKVLKEV